MKFVQLCFCTGLSLPVVWVLKLSCDDADSAVKADSREGEWAYEGLIFFGFSPDSSALYKWLARASGCLT